jgi:hypothetical protein
VTLTAPAHQNLGEQREAFVLCVSGSLREVPDPFRKDSRGHYSLYFDIFRRLPTICDTSMS